MLLKPKPCPLCQSKSLRFGKLSPILVGILCRKCGLRMAEYERLTDRETGIALDTLIYRWNHGETDAMIISVQDVPPLLEIAGHAYEVQAVVSREVPDHHDPMMSSFWKRKGIVAEVVCKCEERGTGLFHAWEFQDGTYSKPARGPLPRRGFREILGRIFSGGYDDSIRNPGTDQ